MDNLKETKGYANFRGVISGLHNRRKGSSKTVEPWGTKLRFFIKTSEHNSIPVELTQFSSQVGKPVYLSSKNEDGGYETKSIDWSQRKEEFEGWQLIGVSVRSKNHEDTSILVPIDAIEYIENNFNDGDSVFVSCRINRSQSGDKQYVNYEINRMYAATEDIDFEDEEFEEISEFKEDFIFDSYFADKNEGKMFIKGKTIQYGGKITPVVYTVWTETEDDKAVAKYIADNCEFGTIVSANGIIHNRVIGEWVETADEDGVLVGRKSKSFGKPSRHFVTHGELKEYQITALEDLVKGAYAKADFEPKATSSEPEWLR